MMKQITKRDVLFFFAGMFLMFAIEAIYDWDNTQKAFKDGWNEGHSNTKQEQTK